MFKIPFLEQSNFKKKKKEKNAFFLRNTFLFHNFMV